VLDAHENSVEINTRGVQKNFPRALKAHLEGLPKTTPVEIWFEDEARIGQKNGQVGIIRTKRSLILWMNGSDRPVDSLRAAWPESARDEPV
jgi:hypothetical protein